MAEQKNQNEHLNVEDALTQSEAFLIKYKDVYKRQVDGGHEMFGFWENEEQEKASIKELNKNGTYNIVFDGTVDGDVINGNIKGSVIATSTFERCV